MVLEGYFFPSTPVGPPYSSVDQALRVGQSQGNCNRNVSSGGFCPMVLKENANCQKSHFSWDLFWVQLFTDWIIDSKNGLIICPFVSHLT